MLLVFFFMPASVVTVLSSHRDQALLCAWEAQAACAELLLSPCVDLWSGCHCGDSHQNLHDSSVKSRVFFFFYISLIVILCAHLYFFLSLHVL